MAEDIIVGLSRSRLLRVTSRQSSLAYDAEQASTAQACADSATNAVPAEKTQAWMASPWKSQFASARRHA